MTTLNATQLQRGVSMNHYKEIRRDMGTTHYTKPTYSQSIASTSDIETRQLKAYMKTLHKGRDTTDDKEDKKITLHELSKKEKLINTILETGKTPDPTQEPRDTPEPTQETIDTPEPRDTPEPTQETIEPRESEDSTITDTNENTKDSTVTGGKRPGQNQKKIVVSVSLDADKKKAGGEFLI